MAAVDRPQIDTSKPSIARVYDAFIGGKDNFEVDREVLRQILQIAPDAVQVGKQCRGWLIRVVRYLAGQAGIDQFLDLGSGLPSAENTHQAAQRINPEARVVYFDIDPSVVAHGRALLVDNEYTHFEFGDMRNPAEILENPVVTKYLDRSRPVALIQGNTMHHVAADRDPIGIMSTYVDALAPGSFLAISHLYDPDDGTSRAKLAEEAQAAFKETMGTCYYRKRHEIQALFNGLEMIEPGLTYLFDWWPDGPRLTEPSDAERNLLGGVARKP
ncbi:SAM-dependent methyltransferase [Saccharopolyspora shandongensis]|uniref:SAM-dependent methyltransferase n=1 Tax=Saccharopolyspora shandongensis TaxID=418495 RepID=UPI0033FD7C4B